MADILKHIVHKIFSGHLLPTPREYYICSFTQFVPLCRKRYVISNYKDFAAFAQA